MEFPKSGVLMPMGLAPGVCERAFELRQRSARAQTVAQRADGNVVADRPYRKEAVRVPVAGDKCDRRRHLDPARRWDAAPIHAQQESVWP